MSYQLEGIPCDYSVRVLRFKQFLPAGPLAGGGVRQQDLVQLWTDPGGLRTLALESIRLGRRHRQKVIAEG